MADEKIENDVEQVNTEEVFGKPSEPNAFGITENAALPKTNDEIPADEPKKEEAPSVEEKPAEESKEEKPAETQASEDALLKQLKTASPEFAAICEKKGIKDTKQAFKLYVDQEKEFTRRSAAANTYKKLVEPYYTIDEQGNVTGYTELGRKMKELGQNKPTENKPEVNNDSKENQNIDLNQLTPKFWELFEQNPIEAVVRIAKAVSEHNINGRKGDFEKSLNSINDQLKPILEERENQRLISMIDDVAKDQVQNGDEKAQEFIDEYADEIEAELNKIAPEFRKANPKLAIEQAYLKVKGTKIKDWQNQMLKKQAEATAAAASASNTGTGSNSPVEPEIDPEIAEMLNAAKSKSGSAFFGS